MTQIDIPPRVDGTQRLRGYLARPDGTGPWPGVVLIHEAWGLDEEMRKHADRLAGMGYLTLAPDLYSQGGARRCLVSTMVAMVAGKGRAFADIEAARTWLVSSADCTGRVGAIGFCMGGGFALLSVHTMAAVSANYGFLPRNLDEAMAGACPVLAAYRRARPPAAGRASAAVGRTGPCRGRARRHAVPGRRARVPQRGGERPAVAAAAAPCLAFGARTGVRRAGMAPDRGLLRRAPQRG
ncbi:hypothetical protein JCM33774_58580 [Actinophytocola sp. KF-1]